MERISDKTRVERAIRKEIAEREKRNYIMLYDETACYGHVEAYINDDCEPEYAMRGRYIYPFLALLGGMSETLIPWAYAGSQLRSDDVYTVTLHCDGCQFWVTILNMTKYNERMENEAMCSIDDDVDDDYYY